MKITADEVRAELDRVLQSEVFARSERCCRFLSYVSELTLSGQASRINEHLIGIEVFGRGSTYSPAEDAIVRRQAHALRYKLEEYYTNGGRNDPIRIALPTGHYVPVFRRRSDPAISDGVDRNGEAPGAYDHAPAWFNRRLAAAALLGALAALFGGWLLGRTGREVSARSYGAGFPASTLAIWSPWLADDDGPVICLSNPMTTRVRQVEYAIPSHSLGRNFTVDPTAEQGIRQWFRLSPEGHVYLLPSISQAKMGDALAAAAISNLLGRAGVGAKFTQSRFLTWEDLRSENVILLGHPETNAWIEPLLQDYPLQVTKATGREPARIVNVHPRVGESAEYYLGQLDDEGPSHEYSLISMLRSQDKHRSILVIAGLSSQATQVAGELLTDHSKLEEVVGKLTAAGPTPSGPWLFQMVVKTSVRDKTPTGWGEIVALRVL
jgi:hypothetical protein